MLYQKPYYFIDVNTPHLWLNLSGAKVFRKFIKVYLNGPVLKNLKPYRPVHFRKLYYDKN